jgi:hypothetical protein
LAVLVAAAVLPAVCRADEPGGQAAGKETRRLVEQLGSERFDDREAATQQLSKLGKAALPSLKEAARSPDAEVRRRARQLVEQLEPTPVSPPRRPERMTPAVKSYL